MPAISFLKHKINGAEQENKADKVPVMKGFLHNENSKHTEYNKGDDLLRYFQLKTAHPAGVSIPVGGNGQAIFHQGNDPAYYNGLPQGPTFLLQVIIPGKSHENVGGEE